MENLEVYLGLPLLHDRVTVSTFNFIVSKVRQKLSGWEAKKLSLAGCITLVRSTILSILKYFMYTVRLPISICREIDKIACNFIWGSSSKDRKIALLSWDRCYQPIDIGGLAIRKLNNQNRLFLMKLDFRFLFNSESL